MHFYVTKSSFMPRLKRRSDGTIELWLFNKKVGASDTKLAPLMVPVTGIEPVRCCHRGILSPLRLPVPPYRHKQQGRGYCAAPLHYKVFAKKCQAD